MAETIFACVLLAFGGATVGYAVFGRLLRFHRPPKWRRGGTLSLTAELACGSFLLCLGLSALQHTGVWVVPAIAAWVVGYVSQWRAGKQHAAAAAELRERNAESYPGVFEGPPPEDIEAVSGDELDVYDAGACTYLGRAAKGDVKSLVSRFSEVSEGPNDIFLIVESLEMLDEGALSEEFRRLLERAFEERDFLVLRWLPPREVIA